MKRKTGSWFVFYQSCSGKKVLKPSFPIAGCVFWIVAAVIVLICGETEARTVRVGIYDNPPKVEMGDNGTPCGIFIDIIEYIAQREGWDIKYVQGTWDAGLTRLEKDSIDLMPDVALSDIRDLRFNFNQFSVLCSWLQVYCRKDIVIESVSALEGKTIAVLEGSIQQQVCEEIRERFGLSFNQIALPDYESTIKQVKSGKADAVIVSRFYGYRREKEGALIPTPVILHPTALHFVAPKGRNQDLLDAIDKRVAEMMNDPHSVYYRSLAYWLHEKPRMFVPLFIIWSIVAITTAFLFFFTLALVLRWLVQKRTKELLDKNKELGVALLELKTTQDEAIKRERLYAFGQLASGVAHDFNNLLGPIMGCADLMLSDPREIEDRENVLKNLEVIAAAAKHGREIVGRMQQFHHSVTPPAVKDWVDANAYIREVIELTKVRLDRPLPGGTPVKVVLKLCTDSVISGRRSDIHEVLLNLVLNAVDAMPEGGRLEISTENIGSAVTITVKDNGIGMTEEIREKCLQPFFTTKGAKGTGIGLSMVSNIVAEHSGQMKIVSAMGAGTSFIITFPCAPRQAEGPKE